MKKNKINNSKSYSKRENKKVQEKQKQNFDDQVEGRNSVLELLESEKDINKIFVTRGEKQGSINKIIGRAKGKGIVLVEVVKASRETAQVNFRIVRENPNNENKKEEKKTKN